MLAGLLLLTIVTMKLFPLLPVSHLLHRHLVEIPLRQLEAMDRRHLIFGVILLGMLFAGAELIVLLGSTEAAMLVAWDVSIYVDALLAGWSLAALARSRAGWQSLAGILRRPLRGARRRAPRRRRGGTQKPANDADADSDSEARTYAFAA